MVNEFHGINGFRFSSYTKPPVSVEVTGDEVLRTFGFATTGLAADTAALVVMSGVFLLGTYLLLRLKVT
jgi:hypothetical protein